MQRNDAGQKIDDLKDQLQGNADHMQHQAQETAEHMRSQVEGAVDHTVESIQGFDFNRQVQERPLMSLGAALLGGFVLGGMMGGNGQGHQGHADRYPSANDGANAGSQHHGPGIGSQIRNAAKKSGLEDTIENAAAALMGSVTEQVKGTLNSKFPGYSDKMETAQHESGSFRDKSKATQQEAQQA